MAFNLLIPEINNKPKNTKDAVISILTIDWPLSLMKIFHRIKKKYRFSYSYQAVYKAVKELMERGILKEKDNGYEIDIAWVKELQSFTDIVETNYYAKEKLNNFSGLKESKRGEDMVVLTFESLFDAEKYLYYFMKIELLKKRNKVVCYQTNYDWRPLFYLRAEYNYFTKLRKRRHKFYFFSSGSSSLDESSRKFYKSLGVNVRKSRNMFANNLLVFSDYFIQIFIPKSVEDKIERFMREEEKINLLKVLDTKGPIKIVVYKDKSLAEERSRQILKTFK